MNREVDVDYLRACGLSEEQIKVIEEAFACEDANSGQTGEDAIKRLRDILAEATETDNSVCYVTSDDTDALKAAIKALEQEPKTGYWIGGDGNYICSCCRRDPLDFLEPCGLDGGSYMDTPMKYCPHCGAKMQGESGVPNDAIQGEM